MSTDPAATAPPGAAPAQPWRRSFEQAAVVWVATHLVFLIATVVHHALSSGGQPGYAAWRQWDGWSFERIAIAGYGNADGDTAFFPLYPLVARAVDALLPGDVLVALLVVSNLCGYAALVLLHRLVATETTAAVADRTILAFAVFPTAYFLAAPYNHSLFLALTLGFLYAVRRRAWWLAALLGALASATRPVGVLLVLPFAFEYLRVRGSRARLIGPSAAWILAIPAGLVAYAAYCSARLHDPLAFAHAQSLATWDRGLSWPGQVLWDTVTRFGDASYSLLFDLGGMLIGVALLVGCVWGPWALRRDQWVLPLAAAPVLALPLFLPSGQDNPLLSNARLLLDCAVLFLVLGRALARPVAERLYLPVALALQFGLTLFYLRGEWTF